MCWLGCQRTKPPASSGTLPNERRRRPARGFRPSCRIGIGTPVVVFKGCESNSPDSSPGSIPLRPERDGDAALPSAEDPRRAQKTDKLDEPQRAHHAEENGIVIRRFRRVNNDAVEEK
eukprot:4622393-Prymnesium_polylepis.2